MVFDSLSAVRTRVAELRERLERHYGPDTAFPGTPPNSGSAGHCAATALIVRELLGGELVSTFVAGTSHWFNRLQTLRGAVDVDLTGDQFGFDRIGIAAAETLFQPTRTRHLEEVRDETLVRAATLAARAGLLETASRLRMRIQARSLPGECSDSAVVP